MRSDKDPPGLVSYEQAELDDKRTPDGVSTWSTYAMIVLKPILKNLIWRPRRVVAIDDQRTWKAFEIYLGALHLAKAIKEASDKPNIGMMLPTSGLSPMAIIATWILGRTIVPLDYLLKHDDLAYTINDAELDTVITVGPMLDRFGPLPEHVKALRLDEMSFKGRPPFRRAARRDEDELAVILYTSGTSGKPKGVMLTCANINANVNQCIEWANFLPSDVFMGVLPQFHSFGFTVLTVLPLARGCTSIYTAQFLPKRILKLLRTHRPTALVAIPSMYNALASQRSAQSDDFASIKYLVSGGEPLSQSVFNTYQDKFNITINEGYGLTETAPVSNWCRPEEHKRHSVGRPLPGVEEKIVDADGNRLGANTDGEVCIKGPNIMKGYYKLPDETDAVFDDEGFFHTGDMGRMDDEGHLYITGRFKEMLIIGGENVFPREIEEVLNAHPAVHSSAVIGMQDDSRGEVALAFIELEEDAAFDETEIRSHCRETLAQFKVPREIRVLHALPRNPTGKIMRRALSIDQPSEHGEATAS